MITKEFIRKAHGMLDELNYHETQRPDFDKFNENATKTLTLCETIEDARNAVLMYQFCLKNWEKIERMFEKKLGNYNNYQYNGNSLINIIAEEDAEGTFYITNGINRDVHEIMIASQSIDEDTKSFFVSTQKRKYFIYEDGDYYITHAKKEHGTMKMYNKIDSCVCDIVLSESLDIFLENNRTPYELIAYEDCIGVYDKAYIEGLSKIEEADPKNFLASIEWDLIDEKSDLGIAKVDVYSEDIEIEVVLLFAIATFLSFQRFMVNEKREDRKETIKDTIGALFGF